MPKFVDGESGASVRTKINTVIDKVDGVTAIDNDITITGDLTVDTTTLHVDSTNNRVGVGTTSPSTKLTVSASSGDGIFVEDSNVNNSSPSVKVRGKRTDANASQSFSGKLLLDGHRTDAAVASGKNLGVVAFGGNHTDGSDANILYPASISGVAEGTFSNSTTMPTALAFYTGSTGRTDVTANVTFGSEAMRITSSGDVGIGTSNPSVALDVFGSAQIQSTAPVLRLYDTNSTTNEKYVNLSTSNGALRFQYLTDALGGGGDYIEFPRLGSSVLGMEFYDNAVLKNFISNAGDSYFTSGNVGIGTTNPSSALDVVGTVTADTLTTDGGTFDSRGVIVSHQNNINQSYIGAYSGANAGLATRIRFGYNDGTTSEAAENINFVTATAERMRIDSSGNVGIGTSSPGSKLSIVGLPTSSAGLSAGDIWNDGGTLKIV